MAKCRYTGKSVMFGNNISHSHRTTKHMQRANLRRVKVIENGRVKRVWVSASALKSGLVNRV
jgi:large subunit ribosomal protein L28